MKRFAHTERWALPAVGLLIWLFWGWLPGSALAEVTVDMRASRTELPVGGQVVVQIRITSDSLRGAEVELPSFDGFSVVRQSVQRPMQFSFGLGGQQQVQSSTHYTFVLRADQPGRWQIPAVVAQAGQQQVKSEPLLITVTGSGPGGQALNPPPGQAQPGLANPDPNAQPDQGAAPQPPPTAPQRGDTIDAGEVDPEAFLRTVVDKGRPYEREQVTVTIYLYTRERLHEAPVIEQEPTTDGFWTQDLLDSNTLEHVGDKQVGRARYRVYLLRRFAAFPLRTGELLLGPMKLTIRRPTSVFDIFGQGRGPREPITRSGAPIAIEVQPLPERNRPAGDVAVGRYSIVSQLDRQQLATGDAATLTATIRGYGYIQAVRLPTPAIPGVQVLQPQVRDLIEKPDDHVGGTRVYEWLLVPQTAGKYTVPAFRVPTFDPVDRRYDVAASAPLELTAAGLAVAGSAAPDTQPTDASDRGTPEADDAGDEAVQWGPVRTESALARRTEPLRARGWFAPLLWLPPLAWMLMWAASGLRRWRTRKGASEDELAMGQARKQLERALSAAKAGESGDYFAAVSLALTRALESRLGQAIGSHTRPQLKKRISERGMDDALATRLIGLLSQCDEARFSPGAKSAADLMSMHGDVKDVFERVATFRPTTGVDP